MGTPVPSMVEIRGPEDGVKICCTCGDRLPATKFYFHGDKNSPDGFYPQCKQCRAKARKDQENRKIGSVLAGGEQKLIRALHTGDLRQLLPDITSGSEIILEAFGGIEGLAQKLALDYEAAVPGTPVRAKLLLGVLGFVTKGMEAQEPVNVSTLTDAELREKLLQAFSDDGQRRLTAESEDQSPVGDSESE